MNLSLSLVHEVEPRGLWGCWKEQILLLETSCFGTEENWSVLNNTTLQIPKVQLQKLWKQTTVTQALHKQSKTSKIFFIKKNRNIYLIMDLRQEKVHRYIIEENEIGTYMWIALTAQILSLGGWNFGELVKERRERIKNWLLLPTECVIKFLSLSTRLLWVSVSHRLSWTTFFLFFFLCFSLSRSIYTNGQ